LLLLACLSELGHLFAPLPRLKHEPGKHFFFLFRKLFCFFSEAVSLISQIQNNSSLLVSCLTQLLDRGTQVINPELKLGVSFESLIDLLVRVRKHLHILKVKVFLDKIERL
jgi:hypothetical protein